MASDKYDWPDIALYPSDINKYKYKYRPYTYEEINYKYRPYTYEEINRLHELIKEYASTPIFLPPQMPQPPATPNQIVTEFKEDSLMPLYLGSYSSNRVSVRSNVMTWPVTQLVKGRYVVLPARSTDGEWYFNAKHAHTITLNAAPFSGNVVFIKFTDPVDHDGQRLVGFVARHDDCEADY